MPENPGRRSFCLYTGHDNLGDSRLFRPAMIMRMKSPITVQEWGSFTDEMPRHKGRNRV